MFAMRLNFLVKYFFFEYAFSLKSSEKLIRNNKSGEFHLVFYHFNLYGPLIYVYSFKNVNLLFV
jgi:hypothetical protein